MTDYATIFKDMGQRARQAANDLQAASTDVKNNLLLSIADILETNIEVILAANKKIWHKLILIICRLLC